MPRRGGRKNIRSNKQKVERKSRKKKSRKIIHGGKKDDNERPCLLTCLDDEKFIQFICNKQGKQTEECSKEIKGMNYNEKYERIKEYIIKYIGPYILENDPNFVDGLLTKSEKMMITKNNKMGNNHDGIYSYYAKNMKP